jgi:hypothetical protein
MLWDVETGGVVRNFSPSGPTFTVQFSPDGKRLVTGDHGGEFNLFDVSSGRTIRAFFHDAQVNHPVVQRLAFSPNGHRLLSAIRNAAPSSGDVNVNVNTIKLWDSDTGRLIRSLIGHRDQVVALAFAPDGRRVISASMDRTIRIWDAEKASTLGTTIVGRNGEWITVTPEGFFSASANGAKMLNVVRGLEVYSIDQFYQSLYRPDLVREKLSGDPQGKGKEATSKLDLAKMLAIDRAPGVIAPNRGIDASATANDGSYCEVTQDPGPIMVTSVIERSIVPPRFTLAGKANCQWFFESVFPVRIWSAGKTLLWSGFAHTRQEWMRQGLVEFTVEIDVGQHRGPITIEFIRDNPSDDRSLDKSVFFKVTIASRATRNDWRRPKRDYGVDLPKTIT